MSLGAPRPGRTRALLCILINLAAFPGLGTVLMGRRAGWAQAALMLAGFGLSLGFGLRYIWCAAQTLHQPDWTEAELAACYQPWLWALRWGLGLCAAAWLWALVSSVGIWRREGAPGTFEP